MNLFDPIPVFEHGHVQLISRMGDDSTIVAAARNSIAGKEVKATSDDRALIRYLMRHRHSTPFEAVVFTIEWKIPIFIARQLVRHRTQSLNEMSARYGVLPEEFYTPMVEAMHKQSTKNRQGRGTELVDDAAGWVDKMEAHQQAGFDLYHEMLEAGVARETARIPLGLGTYTKWWSTINLHNLFHLLSLRLDGHAQMENRKFAEACASIVKQTCPLAWEAFEDYRLNAMTFSAQEVDALRQLIDPAAAKLLFPTLHAASPSKTRSEYAEFVAKLEKIVAPPITITVGPKT